MDEPEGTPPKTSPSRLGEAEESLLIISDSEVQNLFAAAAGQSRSQRPTALKDWRPPEVDALQRVLTQYESIEFLARGGMGAVYQGIQKSLNRKVAIKVLPKELGEADSLFLERFKREARVMAQLSHPNIVAVYDTGETEDGLLYFVMEYIEGTDVARMIAAQGRLAPAQALKIVHDVCEALAFAHEEGIIHRDIKPSNVMLDKKGRVKVADFGLARTLDLQGTLLTGSDWALGTADYIAPEVFVPGTKVDQRSDLYAVGVMLYQMLTGHVPRGRFQHPSKLVSQIDERLDAVVDRALQTDREHRYATATDFRKDITKLRQSSPGDLATRWISDEASPSTGPDTSLNGSSKTRKITQAWRWGLSIAASLLVIGAWVLTLDPMGPPTSSMESKMPPYTFPPGQWVNIQQRMQSASNVSVSKDGWVTVNPPLVIAPVTGPATQNGGVRVRFKRSPEKVVAPQLLLRFADSAGYSIFPNGDCLILRRNDPKTRSQVELKRFFMPIPKSGEEFTLAFSAIGDLLIAQLNDQTVTYRLDLSKEPRLGTDIKLYDVAQNGFRDVEVINLEGLSEGEALKRVGESKSIELHERTWKEAPRTALPFEQTKLGRSSDAVLSGQADYPPGQWVPVAEQILNLPQEHQQNLSQIPGSPWITPTRPFTLSPSNTEGQNWGVRARFRRSHDKHGQLQIRKQQTPTDLQTYQLMLNDRNEVELAHFRRDPWPDQRNTRVILRHALNTPILPGMPYTLELWAIGKKFYVRVNETQFPVVTDEGLAQGICGIYTGEAFSGIEFINLNGLTEEEALQQARRSQSIGPLSPNLTINSSTAWTDAFTEPPLKDDVAKLERMEKGYLLPRPKEWRFGTASRAAALHVRGTHRNSTGAGLVMYYEDGADLHVNFSSQHAVMVYYRRHENTTPLKLDERDEIIVEGLTHDYWLWRMGGRLIVALNDTILFDVPDPNPTAAHLALRSHPTTNLMVEKVEYLSLDNLTLKEAMARARLPGGTSVVASEMPASSIQDAPIQVLSFGGHRYQFIRGAFTWLEAKTYAEAMGGHLATLTTPEESEWALRTYLTRPNTALWLGGRRGENNRWYWITGETWDHEAWAKTVNGESALNEDKGGANSMPENSLHLITYAAFAPPGGWDNRPENRHPAGAHYQNGFLVEWDHQEGPTASPKLSFKKHRYQFIPFASNWQQAQIAAEALGGHLVTITDPTEHGWFLQNMASYAERIYLGGQRPAKGAWQWVTGERWQFTAWGRHTDGQTEPLEVGPDDVAKLEFASFTPFEKPGGWNDATMTTTPLPRKASAGFVVEWGDEPSKP